MQSVFTGYAVPNEINKTVLKTRILPFYLFSTFAWTSELIKFNEKLNPNIKKYPTPTRLTLISLVDADFEAKWHLHSYIRLKLAS